MVAFPEFTWKWRALLDLGPLCENEPAGMPLQLAKLTCGVIYTQDFSTYLTEEVRREEDAHFRQIPAVDYIRCASGPRKGQAWWQLLWLPQNAVPTHRCYKLGEVTVHISKHAQHGLRERCLHWANGQVTVLP